MPVLKNRAFNKEFKSKSRFFDFPCLVVLIEQHRTDGCVDELQALRRHWAWPRLGAVYSFFGPTEKINKTSVSINILWPHIRSWNCTNTKQQLSGLFFRVSFPCPQIYRELTKTCGPGSSVGIATGYGLDGPGIEFRWGARFSAPVQTGPEAHPASCTMGTGSFPGGKERPVRDADPSPPSSAVVMKG
jgi:hypothetical protein